MRRPAVAPRLPVVAALGGGSVFAQLRGAEGAAAALALAALIVTLAPETFGRIALLAGGVLAAVALAVLLVPGAAALALALVPSLGMLLFAWHFGATLRAGQEPLITRYIREDFCGLPEGCATYGRALTLFWTWVFLGFAALNLAPVLGLLPASLAGAVTIGLSILLFVGEHAVRARRFPHLPVTLGRTLRAMWQAGRVHHVR